MDATKTPSVVEEGLVSYEAAVGEPADVAALVERAKAGDVRGFEGLMRMFEGRIIAIGIQMGLSRDDSLDACQDAFVKVFRYIGGFRTGEAFFKWLYRIAINAINDHRRQNRFPGLVSIQDLEGGDLPDSADRTTPLASRLEAADLASRVMAELHTLTRRERIIFILRDLQEMSTGEIGKILRLSQVTVRRHSASARQKLRDRVFPRRV